MSDFRPFDEIEKKIFIEKATGYTFLVTWKEDGKTIDEPKGVYIGKKKGTYRPLSSFKDFITWWARSVLSPKELEHLVEFRNLSYKDLFQRFFGSNNPTVEFLDYKKHLESKSDNPEDKEFKDSLPEEILTSIKTILESKSYLYLHYLNRERTIYEVLLLENSETNTYNILGQSTDKDLNTLIISAICSSEDENLQSWFNSLSASAFGKFKNKRQVVQTALDLLIPMKKYRIEQPETVSNNPEVANYNFLDLRPHMIRIPTKTPTWDSFLELFASTDKQGIFLAWIWSIFDEQNKGRQWMWVQGPGSDGKSSVIKTILHFMDKQFGSAKMYYSANSDSHKNTFFYSNVYSKRLVVFGDNKDTLLFKNEAYQRLSGGDHAPIEAKYVRAFAGKVYSRVLVASNYNPQINFWQDSEVTRAIVLNLDPEACDHSKKTRKEEATFENRLYSEFEDFLTRCYQEYQKWKKPGSHDFILPDSVFNAMKANCANEETNIIQYFMHTCLNFNTSARCRAATLYEKFDQFVDDKLNPSQLVVYKKLLHTALSKSQGCSLQMILSPSGVPAQYMVGCKLKPILPKSYAAVLREEDVLDYEPSADQIKEEGIL